jgi:hypothetical protein
MTMLDQMVLMDWQVMVMVLVESQVMKLVLV